MFGHDDKDKKDEDQVVEPMSTTPQDDGLATVATATAGDDATSANTAADDDISKIVDDINASTDDGSGTDDAPASAPATPPSEEPEAEVSEPTLNETPPELMEVKRSALQELSPILDELDQTADEKFNILMMTIQATDDQALLQQALATAKQIDDKKARAEAMLDIIQEINYFTKKK